MPYLHKTPCFTRVQKAVSKGEAGMEFLDIEAVKDSDEILGVEIRCRCDCLLYESSIEQIDRLQMGQMCEKKCGCGRAAT